MITTELQTQIAKLSEELIDLQAAVAETTETLGHCGHSPADLRDAVDQIAERLLRGKDLTDEFTGVAENVRRLIIFAQIGAWFFRGMAHGKPIIGEVGSPELLNLFNAPPDVALVAQLMRPAPDAEQLAQAEKWFKLFDECDDSAE